MGEGHGYRPPAIKAFTEEGKQTRDTDLRQFAHATLPTLKHHLKMAQQLAAAPNARDQAMEQAMKSVESAPTGHMPTTATPTTTTPAAPSAMPATSAGKH